MQPGTCSSWSQASAEETLPRSACTAESERHIAEAALGPHDLLLRFHDGRSLPVHRWLLLAGSPVLCALTSGAAPAMASAGATMGKQHARGQALHQLPVRWHERLMLAHRMHPGPAHGMQWLLQVVADSWEAWAAVACELYRNGAQ